MNVVTRKEWGARAPKAGVDRTTWAHRTGVTFHHTVTPPDASIRSIQDHHINGRGWLDIGYNFLIDQKGTIFEGRGWTKVGAHAEGHNISDIGIAFIGDYRVGHDGFTAAMARSGSLLYREACDRAGRTLAYHGHRELPGSATECPGGQVMAWIETHGPRQGAGGSGGSTDGPTTSRTERIMRDLPTLRRGDTGVPVTRVQVLCNVAGANPRLVADGDFGPRTEQEIRDLQRRTGVTVDGIVGCGETWPILLGVRP